jgi:hypothetical protein
MLCIGVPDEHHTITPPNDEVIFAGQRFEQNYYYLFFVAAEPNEW